MCGIIGYVGSHAAVPVLLDGLKRLEYRGYDSAGIAVLEDGTMTRFRRAGRVEALAEEIPAGLTARIGIGHTRWATHGPPTEENAHPHLDCQGRIAVVHNGIIENFRELKDRLAGEGHRFRSQTDTEVLAHLIEAHDGGDLRAAVSAAVAEAQGAFALAVLSQDEPQRLIVARRGSPLVVGLGEGGVVACSDLPAIVGHATEVLFLADDELAELTRDAVGLFDLDGRTIERRAQRVAMDPISIQKAGYKHFMLKEIHEQPRAVGETLREKLPAGGTIEMDELDAVDRGFDRVYLIACGTAFHAALTAEYLWEQVLPVPVQAVIASEFRLRQMHITPRTLVVAVSQSGETLDTLMAVRRAREGGATVIALLNAPHSAIEREAATAVYTRAGIEIGVAATKTFSAQIAGLAVLGLSLAAHRTGDMPGRDVLDGLRLLPGRIAQTLRLESQIESLAERLYTAADVLFLGRGVLYPIALEGALKLKEISYIHAEGYPAGEMKHGPIALIDERMPVVVLLSRHVAYDKVLGNVQEVKARNGIVVALTDRPDDPRLADLADYTLAIPEGTPWALPILYALPLQLLAYHIAVLRGTDVDQPRNLAKTVTVE
jgi:glutamine---fructose-6-phosphate transaminase (isomerizing)